MGVGVRPRGACSLPEPAHPSGKCSNRPKTRNASQPASANLALNRGQTKQSPEDKCLCPQGCPARAAEKPPRTEGPQSAQHLVLRCQSQTLVLIPVGSLSSCATLDKPPSLGETQSRDIIPDHKRGPSGLVQEKHLMKWWLLSI